MPLHLLELFRTMTNQNTDAFDPTDLENKTQVNTSDTSAVLEIQSADESKTTDSGSDETLENDTVTTALQMETKASKDKKFKARTDAKSLLLKLTETYPDIFPKAGTGRPVALAIGLHKSLLPIVKAWGFDGTVLRSALSWYTKQLRYQRALVNSEFRINLDGTHGEVITPEQKEHARLKITETENWLAENKPEKANAIAERKKEIASNRHSRKDSAIGASSTHKPSDHSSELTSAKPAASSNKAQPTKEAHSPHFKRRSRPSDKKDASHKTLSGAARNQFKTYNSKETNKTDTGSQTISGNFEDKINGLLEKFNKH